MVLTDARRQVAAVLLAGPPGRLLTAGRAPVLRSVGERMRAASHSRDGMRPALVFGAGAAGSRVIDAMLNEESDLYPVGLLDDDVRLAKLRVRSVSVRGTRADLARVAQATGAEVLVLAMPSVTADDWAAIGREGRDCGLEVLNLPPVTQLFGTVTVKDFQPVTTQDLLGRDQVRTGLMDISNYLSDKRVLVTGAGGSIGSELCRQIRQFNPATLVMLDVDDTALQELQLGMEGHGLLDDRSLVIASVRDSQSHARGLQEAPPPGGVPRRCAQAPAAAGTEPGRGLQDQHAGHLQRARGRRGHRRGAGGQRVHRQGRRPHVGARPHQASG
jgi:FlaA1/EpsC-like NDP-sugar epimerase